MSKPKTKQSIPLGPIPPELVPYVELLRQSADFACHVSNLVDLCVAANVKAAVAAEREACAKIANDSSRFPTALDVLRAIRARGTKETA